MPNIVGSLPVAIIIVVGVCAPLAGWLARQRARNPALWFVFGAVLGPIAPLLLVAAPLGRCVRCGTRTQGWSGTCAECGAGLGGVFDEDDAKRSADRQPALTAAPRAAAPPAVVRAAPVVAAPSPAHPVTEAAAPPARAPRAPAAPALGTRSPSPSYRAPAATVSGGASTGEVLATAVYLSGNAGMEVGACYALARVEDRIRVFGPVDTGQLTVRHELPLDQAEVVALEDRLVITLRRGRSTTSMVMRWVGGLAPAALESALAPGAQASPSADGRRR